METNNINFNQIEFGRLEPNSLYAVKFANFWSPEKVCVKWRRERLWNQIYSLCGWNGNRK